ncbi:myosin light chain kinase 2, skeletal/cardiac muscle-like [Carcharodon carcharias]|uniref:myosin light chain kinase 2, skeletal/cardiac muscle-like n=1 Tax=Carcharodon carcharias TaxID=13397 RepID=UPI001B7F36C3|nr:myosin light chain kinase 2, skeletal/cardiac muscle-like [Carcharodon carcharias]
MATVRELSAAYVNNSLSNDLNMVNVKLDSVNKKVDRLLLGQERLLKQLEQLSQDTASLEKEVDGIKSGQRAQRPEDSCCICKNLHQDISQMLLTLGKMYKQNDERMGSLESSLAQITERFQKFENSSGLSDSQVDRTERQLESAARRLSEQAGTEASDAEAATELSDDKDTLTQKESLKLIDKARKKEGEVRDDLTEQNHMTEGKGVSGSKEASLLQEAEQPPGAQKWNLHQMYGGHTLQVPGHPAASSTEKPIHMKIDPAGDLEEGRLGSGPAHEQVGRMADESDGDALTRGEDGSSIGMGSSSSQEVSPVSSLQHDSSCEEMEARSVRSIAVSTDRQPEDSSLSASKPGQRAQASGTEPAGASQSHDMKFSDLNPKFTTTSLDEPADLGDRSCEDPKDRANKGMLEDDFSEHGGETSNHDECAESENKVPRLGTAALIQEESAVLQASTGKESCIKVIEDRPPLPAPFEHRFVSFQKVPVSGLYKFNPKEVLGG